MRKHSAFLWAVTVDGSFLDLDAPGDRPLNFRQTLLEKAGRYLSVSKEEALQAMREAKREGYVSPRLTRIHIAANAVITSTKATP